MKSIVTSLAICALAAIAGCQPAPTTTATTAVDVVQVSNQTVPAACGECQLGMEGNSCDLAVRIDGQDYFVDGTSMDDHGDAHADDGMCSCIREAKVSGEIKDGRFVASSFELLPRESMEKETDSPEVTN